MPNRIIRESITTSPTLDALSAEAERLFQRLVVKADDYGRFEADPRLILAACFPLRVDRWTAQQVQRWYGELERVGLVRTYAVHGRAYGAFVTWDKHQERRAKHSKFPAPPPETADASTSLASASTCSQTPAKVPEESRNEEREVVRASARRPRAKAPLPDDWAPSTEDLAYASAKGLTAPEVTEQVEEFRGHYLAAQTPWARWDLVWQRWVREYLRRGRPRPRPPHRPPDAPPPGLARPVKHRGVWMELADAEADERRRMRGEA